ncbi:MAG: glycosyltransferase family 4 protein [Lachnospiraceae bacterium]|nr:glycosyltransferase family 4 protein [Lachnospiraceae bacterium]
MRILLVHNYYKVAGGEDRVFENERKLLEDHGHRVYCYARDNKDMKPWQLLTEAIFSRRSYRELRRIIREKAIDLVHVHNTQFLVSPAVFKAAKDQGVPVVQTLHNFRMVCVNAMLYRNGAVCRDCLRKGVKCGIGSRCYRGSRILSLLLTAIRGVNMRRGTFEGVNFICLTDFNRRILSKGIERLEEAYGIEKGAHRFFVKPNFAPDETGIGGEGIPGGEAEAEGLDGHSPGFFSTEKTAAGGFPASETRPASLETWDKGGDSREKYFIYVGRIDPLKGLEDILLVWRRVPSDIFLYVCGDGEDKEFTGRIETLAETMPNVRLLGRREHDETLSLMAGAEAMIFASKWYEGFPMTIIECFSVGRPVLGLDFGNGGDILSRIYGSRKPLMKSMEELPDRVQSFRAGDYSFSRDVLREFRPEANYEKLMEIYRELLKAHPL